MDYFSSCVTHFASHAHATVVFPFRLFFTQGPTLAFLPTTLFTSISSSTSSATDDGEMGVFNALVSGNFLPWKRANRETDYETVLSALESEITSVQSRLTTIRLRERRASVTLTLQAFLLWALYTGLCWFLGVLTLHRSHSNMLVWLPVLGSPVVIVFTRRIVRWWYRRVGAAEEKHLIDLKRQKRDKVDEIKRATKYDHLRMLLDKYDDSKQPTPPPPATPTKKGAAAAAGSKSTSPANKATPSPQRTGAHPPASAHAPNTPEAAALQAQRMALMRSGVRPTLPPPQQQQRTWMDKLADSILGSDPTSLGPEQKYALICTRCHAHNGLALKEEFSEVQYVCPHCGHFNSRRPSSAPVSSPFKPRTSASSTGEQGTPSKVGAGSRLKLRADEEEKSDDEDRPPKQSLQDEKESQETVSIDSKEKDESSREARMRSLRSRKSAAAAGPGEGMDLDD